MGTRSVTYIHEMDSLGGGVACAFYRQYDGYPSGHGQDLADWLQGKSLVNGIGSDFRKGIDHNRAGQMAIDLMYDLKKETSIECCPLDIDAGGLDFVYHVYFEGGEFFIKGVDPYYDKELKVSVGDFDAVIMESELGCDE